MAKRWRIADGRQISHMPQTKQPGGGGPSTISRRSVLRLYYTVHCATYFHCCFLAEIVLQFTATSWYARIDPVLLVTFLVERELYAHAVVHGIPNLSLEDGGS